MRSVVVDASVAVKWFKAESGSDEAWELLERHARGEIDVHIPAQCLGEVLAVVTRTDGPAEALAAWVALDMASVHCHGFDDSLLREAQHQIAALRCDLYGALAPALAHNLEATLYSADRRAHGRYPGVMLL
jgi:predicted nucleic acid-binding protein